jgi:hypothetical protein
MGYGGTILIPWSPHGKYNLISVPYSKQVDPDNTPPHTLLFLNPF